MTGFVKHLVKDALLSNGSTAPGILCEQYRMHQCMKSSRSVGFSPMPKSDEPAVAIARAARIVPSCFFVEGAFFPEQMVIVLSEAMRLVANVLQQPERERAAGENDRM
jgi:hypothetical protein